MTTKENIKERLLQFSSQTLKKKSISMRELSPVDLFYLYIEIYKEYGILLPVNNAEHLESIDTLADYIDIFIGSKE